MLGLIAVLGSSVAVTIGVAVASGPGHAVAAKKKKCKKHKRSAASAKKKCKHKKVVSPPATPPSGPTTRASITWDTSDRIDLHTYDASGDHSGWRSIPVPGFEQGIPNAQESEPTTTGLDTFVDDESPSTRTFTFYVCLFAQSGADAGDVHVIADITDPGGSHRSIPVTLHTIGDAALVAVSPASGTAYPAPPNYCGLAG